MKNDENQEPESPKISPMAEKLVAATFMATKSMDCLSKRPLMKEKKR